MARLISSSPLLARVGLQKVVELYNEKIPKFYPDLIGETISSKQAYEEMLQSGDFGMAGIVTEGTGVVYDDFQTPYSKRFYPVMRSIGFQVSKQAKYTDLYGEVAKPAKKLAQAMNKTKEQKVANIINNMTSASGAYAGPDGVALISTSHPLASGTGSNRPATDIALGSLALAQGIQELGKTKSHRGDPSPYTGPFLLFVPFDLMDLANRVTFSTQRAQTADNDKNVVGSMISKVHVNPYFTSTTAWGLIDVANNPLFMLNRLPLATDEDYSIDLKIHKFTIEEEYEANFMDWRGFWGTAGA